MTAQAIEPASEQGDKGQHQQEEQRGLWARIAGRRNSYIPLTRERAVEVIKDHLETKLKLEALVAEAANADNPATSGTPTNDPANTAALPASSGRASLSSVRYCTPLSPSQLPSLQAAVQLNSPDGVGQDNSHSAFEVYHLDMDRMVKAWLDELEDTEGPHSPLEANAASRPDPALLKEGGHCSPTTAYTRNTLQDEGVIVSDSMIPRTTSSQAAQLREAALQDEEGVGTLGRTQSLPIQASHASTDALEPLVLRHEWCRRQGRSLAASPKGGSVASRFFDWYMQEQHEDEMRKFQQLQRTLGRSTSRRRRLADCEDEEERQHMAATIIQACFRGHLARKALERRRAQLAAEAAERAARRALLELRKRQEALRRLLKAAAKDVLLAVQAQAHYNKTRDRMMLGRGEAPSGPITDPVPGISVDLMDQAQELGLDPVATLSEGGFTPSQISRILAGTQASTPYTGSAPHSPAVPSPASRSPKTTFTGILPAAASNGPTGASGSSFAAQTAHALSGLGANSSDPGTAHTLLSTPSFSMQHTAAAHGRPTSFHGTFPTSSHLLLGPASASSLGRQSSSFSGSAAALAIPGGLNRTGADLDGRPRNSPPNPRSLLQSVLQQRRGSSNSIALSSSSNRSSLNGEDTNLAPGLRTPDRSASPLRSPSLHRSPSAKAADGWGATSRDASPASNPLRVVVPWDFTFVAPGATPTVTDSATPKVVTVQNKHLQAKNSFGPARTRSLDPGSLVTATSADLGAVASQSGGSRSRRLSDPSGIGGFDSLDSTAGSTVRPSPPTSPLTSPHASPSPSMRKRFVTSGPVMRTSSIDRNMAAELMDGDRRSPSSRLAPMSLQKQTSAAQAALRAASSNGSNGSALTMAMAVQRGPRSSTSATSMQLQPSPMSAYQGGSPGPSSSDSTSQLQSLYPSPSPAASAHLPPFPPPSPPRSPTPSRPPSTRASPRNSYTGQLPPRSPSPAPTQTPSPSTSPSTPSSPVDAAPTAFANGMPPWQAEQTSAHPTQASQIAAAGAIHPTAQPRLSADMSSPFQQAAHLSRSGSFVVLPQAAVLSRASGTGGIMQGNALHSTASHTVATVNASGPGTTMAYNSTLYTSNSTAGMLSKDTGGPAAEPASFISATTSGPVFVNKELVSWSSRSRTSSERLMKLPGSSEKLIKVPESASDKLTKPSDGSHEKLARLASGSSEKLMKLSSSAAQEAATLQGQTYSLSRRSSDLQFLSGPSAAAAIAPSAKRLNVTDTQQAGAGGFLRGLLRRPGGGRQLSPRSQN